MSLVTEAVVKATVQRMVPEGEELSQTEKFRLWEIVVTVLNAAAPHIGGEAIRQAVAAVSPEPGEATGDPYDKGFSNALRMVLKHAEGER